MGIKRPRSGIVGSHIRDQTYSIAHLFQIHGNRVHRYGIGSHAQHAVLGFHPCGQSGAGSSRISHRRRCRPRGTHGVHRQTHHQQLRVTSASHPVIRLRGHHLSGPHAVAYEIEYIFRRRGDSRNGRQPHHGRKHRLTEKTGHIFAIRLT